jgi:hypothetical protein
MKIAFRARIIAKPEESSPNEAFFSPHFRVTNLPTKKNTLRSWNSAQKCREGMKRAKTKTAVPLSAGERYVEFTDSSKQLDRARKALGLKENEALLVFTDGKKEFAVATAVH